MRYAVVKCPYCNMLSACSFYAKRHRCPFCNHVFTIRPKTALSRIVFDSYNPKEIQRYIYEHTPEYEILIVRERSST